MSDTREAWCAYCAGPVPVDDEGCIPCRQTDLEYEPEKRAVNPSESKKRRLAYAVKRRAWLTERHLCISSAGHGKATHGVRCAWCWDVKKRGIVDVLAAPKFRRPRNYRPKRHDGKRWS